MAFNFDETWNALFCNPSDAKAMAFPAALHGDLGAMFILSRYYSEQTSDKDERLSNEWILKALAIAQTDPENQMSQLIFGRCYSFGKGTPLDNEEAFKCYLKSANFGVSVAENSVGVSYETGRGVEKNMDFAYTWYLRSATKGNVLAQNNLGRCYEFGKGVEKDVNKAVEWYLESAKQGNVEAQRKVGSCYEFGFGVDKDIDKAIKWYQLASDKGDGIAQNNLGVCYENGTGVEKSLSKAVELYKLAVENGSSHACKNLGICYKYGTGVEKDLVKAIALLHKAVERGNVNAMRSIGMCYESGEGVEQDKKKAYEWYYKAADLGHKDAQFKVASFNLNEKNYEKAQKYFLMAAEQENLSPDPISHTGKLAQKNLSHKEINRVTLILNFPQSFTWLNVDLQNAEIEMLCCLKYLKDTDADNNIEIPIELQIELMKSLLLVFDGVHKSYYTWKDDSQDEENAIFDETQTQTQIQRP